MCRQQELLIVILFTSKLLLVRYRQILSELLHHELRDFENSQNMENGNEELTSQDVCACTSMCGVICLIICFSVFGAVVVPDLQYVNPWQTVMTFNTQLTDVPFRCCHQTGCTCNQASVDAPTCSMALADLNQTACGNGYYCCKTVCQQCCHQEAYHYACGALVVVAEDWIERTHAMPVHSHSTCTGYRTVCNTCNCKCVQNVTNEFVLLGLRHMHQFDGRVHDSSSHQHDVCRARIVWAG